VGCPDAVVEGEVRESRQIVGRVAPLSGAKGRRWVVQVQGGIGEVPAGSPSAWAGMSGAALFAGEVLIGIIVVDADPQHPGRLELWAVPAGTFANDPRLLAWVQLDGTTDAWSRSPTVPEGSLKTLRSLAETSERVRVLPGDVVTKLLEALTAQRDATNDEETRRTVAMVLAMLRSRNVLYADPHNEIWYRAFASLRDLRDTLSAAFAELVARGPRNVTTLVDLMLTATREYLASHEPSYMRHMAERPEKTSAIWWERSWPGFVQAGLDLTALREVLVGAINPLNAFASSGQQMDLSRNLFLAGDSMTFVMAMGKLCGPGDDNAVPIFERALQQPHIRAYYRGLAAEALVRIGTPTAFTILTAAAQRHPSDIAIIEALIDSDNSEAIPALELIANNPKGWEGRETLHHKIGDTLHKLRRNAPASPNDLDWDRPPP